MSWAAVIAGGAALIGGSQSSRGAKDAADASAAGSREAIAEQRRQFDTTRTDTAPYRVIGEQALNALGSIYGYTPAARPMSFSEWAAKNPAPAVKGGGGRSTVETIVDPANLFGGGKPKGPSPEELQRQAYSDYLAGFDYTGRSGPAGGTSAGNVALPGNLSAGGANVLGRVSSPKPPPGGVTIDNETGHVIDSAAQPGYGGATAAGPPSMGGAGPDYSNFFASPDYQFRRDEGIRGIERTAAARGLTGSGNVLAALADYNSNLAAGEFGNYFNRQAALAGIGQTAVNTATTAGMNSANNVSGFLADAANARASGIAGQADAWNNAFGTIAGIAYDRWGRKKPAAVGGGYGSPSGYSPNGGWNA